MVLRTSMPYFDTATRPGGPRPAELTLAGGQAGGLRTTPSLFVR